MYRRILVAIDLTEASSPALRAALDLGRRVGAEVTVLHVVEPPYEARRWYAPISDKEADLMREVARREREASEKIVADQVKQAGVEPKDGLVVHTVIREGAAADVITNTARELDCDLLVVGTHGRRGLQHALLGSIAERVVRTASCPVLTVRAAR